MDKKLLFKIAAICFMSLLLLVPLALIEGQIRDRSQRQNEVQASIANSAAGSQVVGPVIAPHYRERVEVPIPEGGQEPGVERLRIDLGPLDVQRENRFDFAFPLQLTGTTRLAIAPTGEANHIELKSAWPHPNFGGRFLRGRSFEEVAGDFRRGTGAGTPRHRLRHADRKPAPHR